MVQFCMMQKACYAAAAVEIVECKIIQGKESLSAMKKISLKHSHTFLKKSARLPGVKFGMPLLPCVLVKV